MEQIRGLKQTMAPAGKRASANEYPVIDYERRRAGWKRGGTTRGRAITSRAGTAWRTEVMGETDAIKSVLRPPMNSFTFLRSFCVSTPPHPPGDSTARRSDSTKPFRLCLFGFFPANPTALLRRRFSWLNGLNESGLVFPSQSPQNHASGPSLPVHRNCRHSGGATKRRRGAVSEDAPHVDVR